MAADTPWLPGHFRQDIGSKMLPQERGYQEVAARTWPLDVVNRMLEFGCQELSVSYEILVFRF